MNKITEDYVSYEIAKLLKEKGFKEIVQSLWIGEDEYHYISTESIKPDDYNSGGACLHSAPTHQMALKWLREIHKIFISIVCCTYQRLNKVIWVPDITTFESVFPNSAIECDTYEEACERAIKYVLKNLI